MSKIDHLSYSAIITFLRNQVEFQKRYIYRVYDNPKTPSLVVGSAVHKALEIYYRDGDIAKANEAGLEEINTTSDYEIDYGKTGSREKIIQDFNFAFNAFVEEMTEIEVVETEKRMEHKIQGVPVVGIADMIAKSGNDLKVIDYKTVTSYTSQTNDPLDPEYKENYKYLLQGLIYLILTEKEYPDKKVDSVSFIEIKKTKNRDGTPQLRTFEYDRDSLMSFAPTAFKVITNVYDYVNADNARFFPNPSDMINGEESMRLFAEQEENFDSVKIKRKMNVADKFAPRNVTVDIDETEAPNEDLILRKFIEFGIGGITGKTYTGASVIRYTFKPNRGVAMSSIAKREDDIAIALKSKSVRILAPIAGTDLVGIEIPNENRKTIEFTDELLHEGTFDIPLGQDIFGKTHYGDLTKMPHLLIAGQTGAGKSVMLNVILESLTKQLSKGEMQLVLIDPKEVEFAFYEDDEHLRRPIITDINKAKIALHELVEEMERRYKTLRKARVRKIEDYKGKMPKIVCVIDEFADLMMTDSKKSKKQNLDLDKITEEILRFNQEFDLSRVESLKSLDKKTRGSDYRKEAIVEFRKVLKEAIENDETPNAEHSIIRIAQKARAVGIHLILATQRPSADVVTGLIKANIPTKIAFSTTTAMNSKIILDETGAEKLTGNGDMLYQDPRATHLERLQGFYI